MSKRIKVCYLLNDLMTGGVSKVVYDTLSEINLKRFDVSIVLLSDKIDFLENHSLDNHIVLHICPYEFDHNYSLRRYTKLAFDKRMLANRAKSAIETIVKLNPEILHFHGLPRELLIGKFVKNKNPAIKLVYTDHLVRISKDESSPLKRNLLALVYKRLYKHYNVIAVSKSVRRCQENYRWLNKRKTNVILENRINLSEYPQKEYPQRKKIDIIYVARLSAVKGHYNLLKAFKLIQTKKIHLNLLGGGEMESELRIFCTSENIQNVHFIGNVVNVKDHLYNSDIAVFPSEKEGLPISLLEKMAIGLPIIANNIPELTDFVADGDNGFISSDQDKFITNIKVLAGDHKLRERLGRNARISLIKRFGNKSYSSLIEEFYLDLIAAKK